MHHDGLAVAHKVAVEVVYEAVKFGEVDCDVFAAVRRGFNEENRRTGAVLSEAKRDAAVGFVNALGIIRSCLEEILGDRI